MSGLSVTVMVGAGVAGPPAASALSRGQDVVPYEVATHGSFGSFPKRGGFTACFVAHRVFPLASAIRPCPPDTPLRHPADRHRLPSRTARPATVRVSHDLNRLRRLAVTEPHPVTPNADGRSDEGAVPARTVHEQPVRPRPVPETRKGLL
ncbi:hypothetical protein ACFWB1_36550 [Streptomyces goshikiensis]|uniref:hypothetical protein n=1 Tax=Streptomyces goshikiensis TaxID=1942 RepID=UPI0036B805A3